MPANTRSFATKDPVVVQHALLDKEITEDFDHDGQHLSVSPTAEK